MLVVGPRTESFVCKTPHELILDPVYIDISLEDGNFLLGFPLVVHGFNHPQSTA